MNEIVLILAVAVFIEKLVEVVKAKVQVPDTEKWLYGAIGWGLGLVVGFAVPLDLFAALSHPFAQPLVAEALTGLIVGSGSNAAHEIIDWFRTGPSWKPASLNIGPGSLSFTGTAPVVNPTPRKP